MRAGRVRSLAVVALALILGHPAHAGTVLLKNSWLKQHMNRVTTTSPCRVDTTHKSPNPALKDGDLHMACRCADVGLPMVGEIMNAARFGAAVDAAKQVKRAKSVTQITGVWRLWLEHPAGVPQTQGGPVPVSTTTNPAHSFEIHPITRFGNIDLTASVAKMPGYSGYKAVTAFRHYETRTFVVSRSATFTSIRGKKALYNYALFSFTVAEAPKKLADGWSVMATVDGVVSTPRRMVVAEGTAPAALLSKAKKGMHYQATGIPRIDLSRINAEVSASPSHTVTLVGAYEMVLVALAKKS